MWLFSLDSLVSPLIHFYAQRKSDSTTAREGFFLEFAKHIRPHLKHTALAVTGGFHTASVIADDIDRKDCDIIGFARPAAAEPRLPRDIIEGKSHGVKRTMLPEIYYMQHLAAYVQIAQMGKGEPITDFSVQKVSVSGRFLLC